jgi:hypothetical protein
MEAADQWATRVLEAFDRGGESLVKITATPRERLALYRLIEQKPDAGVLYKKFTQWDPIIACKVHRCMMKPADDCPRGGPCCATCNRRHNTDADWCNPIETRSRLRYAALFRDPKYRQYRTEQLREEAACLYV